MADMKASALLIAAPLTGAEFWAAVQSGDDRKVTAEQIAAYVAQRCGRVVHQSAAQQSFTGTTAETVLATILVPGGLMGPNGSLRITTSWTLTSSANGKTMRVRFGGSTIQANTATTASYYRMQCEIHNVNSEAIQSSTAISASGFGAGGASPTATTQDTTDDVEITLVGTLSNAGETLTLESYLVEVMPSL